MSTVASDCQSQQQRTDQGWQADRRASGAGAAGGARTEQRDQAERAALTDSMGSNGAASPSSIALARS
jgi:hypothetical protein